MTITERPMRRDAARNRQLLLDAAREVFAERGLDASLDDVARAAGVGVGTAYRHFANKHDLAAAIFGEALEEFAARTEEAVRNPDPWSGIVEFLESATEGQAFDRGLREVIYGVHDPELTDRMHERLTGPLTDLVGRAKAAGQLPASVQVTDLAVITMMLCTVSDLLADDGPDLWRRYLALLLAGLRSGDVADVPAVDNLALRRAMASYKGRLAGRTTT